MISYNNDPAFKKKAVEAAVRHRDMDMLVVGSYGVRINGFKGCSIGCDAFDITGEITGEPHQTTADYFGFPMWLELLRDSIFERLPVIDRVNWHVDIKKAIAIGMEESDFDQVKKDFLIWLMMENMKVVQGLGIGNGLKYLVISAINGVINSLKAGEGLEEAINAANAAANAASDRSFTDSAAKALTYSGRAANAAANAADTASYRSVTYAVTYAGRAETYAANAKTNDVIYVGVGAGSRKKQSDKLIELFESYKTQRAQKGE